MSSISNRFFVTALDDGTTLHGNLSVNGSLSQAWDGTSAVPNWGDGTTGLKDQPTIMLTLLSGATYIGTNSASGDGYIKDNYKWYYNNHGSDAEIGFETTQTTLTWTEGGETRRVTGYKSTNGGIFLKHESSINGVPVPCLRIIKNLASDNNVDLDTITFKGQYDSGRGVLDFQATAQIRISRMSSGGYIGVISFDRGISNITDQNQSISMSGTLYGSTNNPVPSFKTAWYKNGESFREMSALNTGITVTGADIVDNAIIRCDFYVTIDNTDTLVATEYASIDDLQDPEMMYIQYAGQNGNAASLRKGQTAVFDIWIGKNNNPAVDTSFAYFQVKLLNGSGQVITGSLSGIPAADGEGWRTLPVDQTTGKASISVSYAVVDANGKNLTGLIRASTSPFS